MKILFVLPYLPSLIRVRPYQFIRELSARHEVTVLATDSVRSLNDSDDLRRWSSRLNVVPFTLGASVRSCVQAALRGEPLQAAVCQSPALERRLHQLIAGESFDVVHIEHLRAARLSVRLPTNMPRVFDSVDSISLLLERTLRRSHSVRQRLVAALELRRTRNFEAKILRRFDEVLVTSPDDRQALLARAPSTPLTLVANGVDLTYFKPSTEPREPATIVFSGKMSYHANVTAALYLARHILPLIRANRPDARLRIVGSNPARSIRALAADPAISVTGYVPDMRPHVGTASVAVCPVVVKVGIQNKVLEAMSMQLPVVSTSAGVEGLGVTPGRDVLVGDTPAEFAAQTCRLLIDAELANAVAAAGRRYVELNHRWSDATAKLEALYVRAIERRVRRAATCGTGLGS